MAKASSRPTAAKSYDAPVLLQPREKVKEHIRSLIVEGKALLDLSSYADLDAAYDRWREFGFDLLRQAISPIEVPTEFKHASRGHYSMRGDNKFGERIDDVKEKLNKLESILRRVDLFQEPLGSAGEPEQVERSNRVFVVHGHDKELKLEVVRLLEHLDLEPVVLHEQPNRGRTVIQKFEDHADVGFAIVLLTPDDVGAIKPTDGKPPALEARARQNVILELGYFVGRLTRAHVLPLHRGELDLPSDFVGVVYTKADAGGAWKQEVARELAEAGYSIDFAKIV